MNSKRTIWAIVPAAGTGSRMQSDTPKQYMLIDGRPVLAHVLDRLLSLEQVIGVVVALRPQDHHWDNIILDSEKPVLRARGGVERSDSVLSALDLLQQQPGFAPQTGWVLVHDAVRPCIHNQDIERLIDSVGDDESGGLLAMPVRDTMKRQSNEQTVIETVERNGLWHAQTPQFFSWRSLHDALAAAADAGSIITDESFAMERAGYTPRLVMGRESNIKITHSDDLRLAEVILREGL